MNTEDKLIIGMPAGSLANASRGGNLIDLLESAGFKTKGYENGGPTSFNDCHGFIGWDGRPQEFGAQLCDDEIDVAIAGDDWIKERVLELKYEYDKEIKLQRVLSLNRGAVRLVGILHPDNPAMDTITSLKDFQKNKKLIKIVSEMPYLALDWIKTRLKEAGLDSVFNNFSVQKYGTPSKIETGVVIYETWGKTEAKIKHGSADLGLEITQSGSAIRNYGLKIIDEVFQSETSIWVNDKINQRPEKMNLLKMFLINLNGAINAEKKVLVIFNIPNKEIEAIENYLKNHNLFADEPTMNKGLKFSEYSIQLNIEHKNLSLARVRYELTELGAINVDTIPITSSIPNTNIKSSNNL
jgi:ATP phosphoribosyltransferase